MVKQSTTTIETIIDTQKLLEFKDQIENCKTKSNHLYPKTNHLEENNFKKSIEKDSHGMEEFELEEHENSEIIKKEEFKISAQKNRKSLKKKLSQGIKQQNKSKYSSRRKLFTKDSLSKLKFSLLDKPIFQNNIDCFKTLNYNEFQTQERIESLINKTELSYTDFEINEYPQNSINKNVQTNQNSNCKINQMNTTNSYLNKMNQLHKIIKSSKNKQNWKTKENCKLLPNKTKHKKKKSKIIKTENNSPTKKQRNLKTPTNFFYRKQHYNTSLQKNLNNQTYNSIYLTNQHNNVEIRNNSSQRNYLKKNKFKASMENNSKFKNDIRNTSMNSNKSESIKRKILSNSRRFKSNMDKKLFYPNNYSAKKINLNGFDSHLENNQISNFNLSNVYINFYRSRIRHQRNCLK